MYFTHCCIVLCLKGTNEFMNVLIEPIIFHVKYKGFQNT